MEENIQHFQCIMFYNLKKVKCNWNTQNKIVQCMEKVLWLNVSKEVCEVSWYYWHLSQIILCCGAVLSIWRCLAAPLASTHGKPIAGDSQHTQNSQISKVTGENEKNVSFILRKNFMDFLTKPIFIFLRKEQAEVLCACLLETIMSCCTLLFQTSFEDRK